MNTNQDSYINHERYQQRYDYNMNMDMNMDMSVDMNGIKAPFINPMFNNLQVIKDLFIIIDEWTTADQLLVTAAAHGYLEDVKYIINELHANVNAYDCEAYLMAAMNGHISVLICLIEHGVDVRTYNYYAIRNAAEHGHLDVVKYLIEQYFELLPDMEYMEVKVNLELAEAFILASENGHLDVVKCLVEYSTRNHIPLIHIMNDQALRSAVKHGHLEVVIYLVEQGADIGAKGNYALRWAAYHGYVEIVKYLVSKGANPKILTDEALRNSWLFDNERIVNYLNAHGN